MGRHGEAIKAVRAILSGVKPLFSDAPLLRTRRQAAEQVQKTPSADVLF